MLGLRRRLEAQRRWRENGLLVAAYLAGDEQKLHLGSGTNLLPEWLNTDLYAANVSRGVAYLDIREPFPLPARSFDFVFSEHLIEHVSFEDGQRALVECRRVLRPGGVVRIATPDLARVAGLMVHDNPGYVRRSAERYANVIAPRPGFVVNNFFRDWGHQFVYDRDTLSYALELAGFGVVTEHEVGSSAHADLCGIERHGEIIGHEDNLFETFVLEAVAP